MRTFVCTVCGYVYEERGAGEWDALPDDWKCPVCGASKDAFEERPAAGGGGGGTPRPSATREDSRLEQGAPSDDVELSAMELSIVCSNLARGCEKQYLAREAQDFMRLADFFRGEAQPVGSSSVGRLLELIDADLGSGFPAAKAAAEDAGDRGALRSLVWSEKVSLMLKSLLARYEREGESMLERTGVWVCSVCGFTFVGDAPPELCPVCKVPAWKFDRMEGRA